MQVQNLDIMIKSERQTNPNKGLSSSSVHWAWKASDLMHYLMQFSAH